MQIENILCTTCNNVLEVITDAINYCPYCFYYFSGSDAVAKVSDPVGWQSDFTGL